MRTRSSSNLPVESPPNPSTSNPKRRNRRRSKQPFILEGSPVDTMADQRTMAELLRAPTEGYAEAIVVPPIPAEQFKLKHSLINMMTSDQYKDLLRACPHHGFTKLHQLDTFYNALNPADQDSLNSAARDNLLARRTQDVLTIIENKSKVRNSRNKSVVSQVKSNDANSNSSSEIAKLTHAVNQQTSAVTTAMTSILKRFQATPPPAFVKSAEEICVTCGGAHPYYQCLAAGGNTFPKLRDNIQGYVAAAAVNYNQGNFGYRPLGSGSLPSNTIANPKGELKAITTRSDIVLDGPSVPIPPPFIILKEDERVEETLTDQNLAEYTIKKLPKKLGDPGKILIPYGFNELKCKALDDLGTSINLIPPSVWKKLGLPKLISTRMTLELANRAICTPAGIARDVFVQVGKFTFPADFFIVDYESDPRVPLILGRPFLRTARSLIDVHGEKMILCDGDERLTLNIRHATSSYSNKPQKESINLINVFNDLSEDFFENFTTSSSSSPTHLLEEFADGLALIIFPLKYDDDLTFDIESDLKEIEYLLHHDPIKDMDSILKYLIDQSNLTDDNLVDTMPEMFTDEHALDYSSPPLYDEYDDDLLEVKSDTEYVYDDPFDSKGEKIKDSKLLIDGLDLPSDFLPSSEYDSFLSKNFSKVDTLPLTNNDDKVFNLGILIQENHFEVITHVAPEKNEKKLAISHASLMLEDFDPSLYELPFFKEVPRHSWILKTHAEFCPPVFTSSALFGNHISKSNRTNVYLLAYLINSLRFT
nr:reverse transcriptase domain-containing protein [Tanacetum cinerariifolium]